MEMNSQLFLLLELHICRIIGEALLHFFLQYQQSSHYMTQWYFSPTTSKQDLLFSQ